jgi:hypothetical protein
MDLLGSGLVVLPPTSCVTGRAYEIIQGKLDDLDDLPVLCDAPKVPKGQRNKELWTHCNGHAPHCESLDDLLRRGPHLQQLKLRLAVAGRGDHRHRPLRLEIHREWTQPIRQARRLRRDRGDGQAPRSRRHGPRRLVTWLRAQNGPNAAFVVANGLANKLGWSRKRLAAVRKHAMAAGIIAPARQSPRAIPVPISRLVEIDHPSSRDTTLSERKKREDTL